MSIAATTKQASPGSKKKKFKLSFPTAYTILFLLTIIAVIATSFVPAGQYSKIAYDMDGASFTITEPGGEIETKPGTQETLDELGIKIELEQFTSGSLAVPVSIPNTYQGVESTAKGIGDITLSAVSGVIQSVDIMVFILILGGLIGTVNKTGAFEAGLIALTKRTKGKEFLLVTFVCLFMILGGTSCGLEEEAVAFYPILVPIFLALGFDSIVCVGAIFLAGSMGTTFSILNPFSVGIASNAAGIALTDGMEWRIFGCIVAGIVVIAYLFWYTRKLKADPTFSYSYEDHEEFAARYATSGSGTSTNSAFTIQKKIILILFVAGFPMMVYGLMNLSWGFVEMAAMFLFISIIIMLLSGIKEKSIVDAFIEGASSLVGVSLIIGLARGINLVMNEGMISDTLLFYASNFVNGMEGPVFALTMMAIFFLLGFIVPSSSGLAVLSMPIFAPLADTIGIDRSTVVCAYQFGQYAMLYIAPTGLILATLTMLNMKYSHWLKFVWPMVIFVLVFGGAILVAQTLL